MPNNHSDALNEYEQVIHELSERIVLAQKPIRILDALKWDAGIEDYFFAHKGKKLPVIDQAYYDKQNPLSFRPR